MKRLVLALLFALCLSPVFGAGESGANIGNGSFEKPRLFVIAAASYAVPVGSNVGSFTQLILSKNITWDGATTGTITVAGYYFGTANFSAITSSGSGVGFVEFFVNGVKCGAGDYNAITTAQNSYRGNFYKYLEVGDTVTARFYNGDTAGTETVSSVGSSTYFILYKDL